MVEVYAFRVPSWLFVPNVHILATYKSLVSHQSGTSGLLVCVAQVQLAEMTALRFLHHALCAFKDNSGSDLGLVTNDSVLRY